MAQNILKDLLRPRIINRKNYKYIQRTDYEVSSTTKLHKYSLQSLLNPSFKPFELYLMYFHSAFLKTRQVILKEQHISRFYRVFLKYIYLHCHLVQGALEVFSSQQEQKRVRVMLGQIMDIQKEQKQLVQISQKILVDCQQTYKSLSQCQKKGRMRTYQDIHKIKASIQSLFEEFNNQIKVHHQQILQKQYLPNFVKDCSDLIAYVKQCLEKLHNLHVLLPYKKSESINCILRQLASFVHISVEKAQIVNNKDKQPHIRPFKEQSKQEKISLLMPRFSNEREPVITSLDNYINFRKTESLEAQRQVSNTAATRKISRPLFDSSLQFTKSLLSFFRSFQKVTNRVYPCIRISDIMFNQKTLQPVVSYAPFIYDALGLTNRKHGSVELQLAVNPTPSAIQLIQSNIQLEQAGKWSLTRKYYVQRVKKSSGREVYVEREQADQRQFLQGCPLKSKYVEQKAHVWRLISIFYFILKQGRHMVQDEYNIEYGRNFPQQVPALEYNLYRQTLKRLQAQLQYDKSLISKKLGISPKKQESTQREKFNYKLQQLEDIFSIEQKDQLLQRMRSEKIISELWVRDVLAKQIASLILNQKYFKKLLNAKKYAFMLLIGTISYCYQLWLSFQQSNDLTSLRRNLTHLKGAEYRRLSFDKQRERKRNYIESTHNKITDYMKREDEQKRYLVSNPQLVPAINQIHNNTKQLIEFEDSIFKGVQYENIWRKRDKVIETINESSRVLSNMLDIELPRLERIEDFHKLDVSTKPQLQFITRKLFYLLKAFSTLNSHNWRKYQTLILPILVQPKTLGIQVLGKKAEDSGQAQLQESIARLKQVGQLLSEEYPLVIIKQSNLRDN